MNRSAAAFHLPRASRLAAAIRRCGYPRLMLVVSLLASVPGHSESFDAPGVDPLRLSRSLTNQPIALGAAPEPESALAWKGGAGLPLLPVVIALPAVQEDAIAAGIPLGRDAPTQGLALLADALQDADPASSIAAAAPPEHTALAGAPDDAAAKTSGAPAATPVGDVPPPLDPAPAAPPSPAPPSLGQEATPPDTDVQHERMLGLTSLRHLLGLPAVLALADDGRTPEGEAPVVERLALIDSIQRGLDNSLDVDAARAKLESFGYTLDAAKGAFRPHLDFKGSVGRGELESIGSPQITSRKLATTTFRQAIIDEPSRHEWGRQQWLTESAAQQYGSARVSAALDAAGAWLGAMQAAVNVQLGREYEVLLEELSRYISERAAAGGASPADRDRVKARVANIRSSLADSRAALVTAIRNLEVAIGAPVGSLALDFNPDTLAIPADRLTARALAEQQNHDLLAARAEIQAAARELATARARFLPRLDLEVSQNRGLNSVGSTGYTHDTTAMLTVSVSILNGGSDLAQMHAAQAHQRQLDATARNVQRKLFQQIDTAYANLDAGGQRFGSVATELAANERVVSAFRAQMVGSNRQLLDVLDAYQHLYQSRLDLTQTLVSQAQNQLRVAQLTSRLDPTSAP